MRARQGLAACSWELGEHKEVIEHYQEMLELNPSDNQGIRYELAGCLLDEDSGEELGRLLEHHEEDASAFWLYTHALLAFCEGVTEKATIALEEAMETNPYVPLYLLGRRSFLAEALPELIGFGDESEAVAYFVRSLTGWLGTPSDLEWLRGNADEDYLAELEEE